MNEMDFELDCSESELLSIAHRAANAEHFVGGMSDSGPWDDDEDLPPATRSGLFDPMGRYASL